MKTGNREATVRLCRNERLFWSESQLISCFGMFPYISQWSPPSSWIPTSPLPPQHGWPTSFSCIMIPNQLNSLIPSHPPSPTTPCSSLFPSPLFAPLGYIKIIPGYFTHLCVGTNQVGNHPAKGIIALFEAILHLWNRCIYIHW